MVNLGPLNVSYCQLQVSVFTTVIANTSLFKGESSFYLRVYTQTFINQQDISIGSIVLHVDY